MYAGNTAAFSTQSPLVRSADRMFCSLRSTQIITTMTKCAFNNCQNRFPPAPNTSQKPGLNFYSFTDVPPAISEQWMRIVGRERCSPNYVPTLNSLICSEHFAPYDISPTKKLYSTAIPSINIGPYDDAIIIPDDEKCIGKESDIVCIIENQISTQPIIADTEDDNIVCIIENQISTEPKTTDEQDIDIENQIQFSLVGTSKHIDGLVHANGPVSKLKPPPPLTQPPILQQTFKEEKEINQDEDVMTIEEETNHDKHEIENESEDLSSHHENENQFKDQYSEFLRTYDSIKLNNYNRKAYTRRHTFERVRVRQNLKNSPKTAKKAKVHCKHCAVPGCKSTTVRTPGKLFFRIPKNEMRERWCEAMGRRPPKYKPLSAKCNRFCCEDHFDFENDMANYLRWRLMGNDTNKPILKKDVIPHRFDCQSVQLEEKNHEQILAGSEGAQHKETKVPLGQRSKKERKNRKNTKKKKPSDEEQQQETRKDAKVSEGEKTLEKRKKIKKNSRVQQVAEVSVHDKEAETYTFVIKIEVEENYELNNGDGILEEFISQDSQSTAPENSHLLDVNVKVEELGEEFEPELVEETQENMIKEQPDAMVTTEINPV